DDNDDDDDRVEANDEAEAPEDDQAPANNPSSPPRVTLLPAPASSSTGDGNDGNGLVLWGLWAHPKQQQKKKQKGTGKKQQKGTRTKGGLLALAGPPVPVEPVGL